MSSSMGRIISHIMENKACLKPPITNHFLLLLLLPLTSTPGSGNNSAARLINYSIHSLYTYEQSRDIVYGFKHSAIQLKDPWSMQFGYLGTQPCFIYPCSKFVSPIRDKATAAVAAKMRKPASAWGQNIILPGWSWYQWLLWSAWIWMFFHIKNGWALWKRRDPMFGSPLHE